MKLISIFRQGVTAARWALLRGQEPQPAQDLDSVIYFVGMYIQSHCDLFKVRQALVLKMTGFVRDDKLGRELKKQLITKAQSGVRVLFLYDEIGSLGLPRAYRQEL